MLLEVCQFIPLEGEPTPGSITNLLSSDYSYYTSHTTVTIFTDTTPTNTDAGCISTFPPGHTTVLNALDVHSQLTEFTTVTGPISMWAQPLQYVFQQKDISLLSTSTSATAVTTSSAVSSTATATATSSSSLSSGAKAGIGIGVAVGVLALISVLIFLFFLRRKKQRTSAQTTTEQAPPAYDAKENDIKDNPAGVPLIGPEPVEAMDTPANNGNQTMELANTEMVDRSAHTSSPENGRTPASPYSRSSYMPYRPGSN